MKKISLNEYKDYKQYFIMFDILIKSVNSNKEEFLQSLYLSPSSYRRAKNDGNKIGAQLTKELCAFFKLKLFNDSLIDEVERKINAIYFNIYYKIYDTYEEDLNWVNKMIEENYVFFPILKLIKLLMILNGVNSPKDVVEEYNVLFKEIKSYEEFYNQTLLELLEIEDVFFKKELDSCFMAQKFNNELSYHTLSSKCTMTGKYIESIYFCHIAKESFIKEENFKRVYYINLILMANYNSLCNFEEAYKIEKKQIYSLKSLKEYEFELMSTNKHYMITCLGLKKYKEVINILDSQTRLNLTEIVCCLISKYYVNKKDYEKEFNELMTDDPNISNKELYVKLDRYLKTKDKKILLKISNFRINKVIVEILKKCN